MAGRIEVGPVLAAIAAIVLLVSLFLDWYAPALNAWAAFEAWDLVLAALAVAALVAAAGVLVPDVGLLDRRWLMAVAAAALVIVVAEILDPPPAAAGAGRETGAWLAFAAALAMVAGAVLSVGRVSFAVTVEGRDLRRRVAAVDTRADTDEAAARPQGTGPDAP